MKHYVKSIILIAIIFLFTGCYTSHSSFSMLNVDQVMSDSTVIPKEYEDYGAFYIFDETHLEASLFRGMSTISPMTRVAKKKRLKILNEKGLEYATMKLPLLKDMPDEYSFSMWDSNGTPVPINISEMYSEYRKTGKVVFPNVTTGCEMEVKIMYDLYTSIPAYEHWFGDEIPVYLSRLTFSSHDNFTYKTKLYGPTTSISESKHPEEKFLTTVWEMKNVMPLVQASYTSFRDSETPRVSFVLKRYSNVYGFSQEFNLDWRAVCESYQDFIFQRHALTGTPKLTKIIEEHTHSIDDKYQKAEVLYNWVRDSMDLIEDSKYNMNLHKILSDRKGNVWEITYVLRELYRHIGLHTNIILTRSRESGGFDRNFVSSSQVQTPLLLTLINGKMLIAYPFSKAAKLGEYPLSFAGLEGVKLMNGTVTKIPESTTDSSLYKVTTTFDTENRESPTKMELNLKGYWAFFFRSYLQHYTKQEQDEMIQRILTQMDKSNALISAEISNLDIPGDELTISLDMKNDDNIIERKGQSMLLLNSFFNTFFESIVKNRSIPIETSFPYVRDETIRFINGANTVELDKVSMNSISNPLFTSQTTSSTEGNDLILKRTVSVKTAKIPVSQIPTIYQDLQELNSISDNAILF